MSGFRHVFSGLAVLALAGGVALAEEDSGQKEVSEKAAEKAVEKAAAAREVAVIETEMGDIVIEFFEQDAPKTAANFKKLAREKFYDGTTFHRVIPGFVIQGGDPNSKDKDRSNDGQGGPGYTVPAEIERPHKRGAVATARLPDQVNPKRESSGSQFFVCVKDLPQLDKGGYTVFGHVIEGMDVVDKIVAVRRDGRDNPIEPVVMKKVTIQKRDQAVKAAEADEQES